jgi:hypothetical protein
MATSNYPYKVELRACGDCAVLPGYEHSDGCDVARCPECGIQRLQCEEHEDSTLPAIWTGIWPGEIECVEYDLWSKWVEGEGWVETTADDPEREPNLNKLATMPLVWSKRLQRFVKPDFEEGA